MKTENTLENKAKFFALYWYQKVYKKDGYFENEHRELDPLMLHYKDNQLKHWLDGYLELTPLSQITDEDAIQVAKINGELKNPPYKFNLAIESVRMALAESLNSTEMSMPIEMIDYLRSKSYALPFLDLSINDLIEYKWIVLKD